jgi:SAM-dependent methyltransferase
MAAMQKPPTPDTPESWNAASRGYAERVAPLMMEEYADEFVDRLDVDASTEALEVAAGSGALTQALSKRVKSLLATDFAPEMVEILRERVRAAGAHHVNCEVMDGQALALDDGSFDRAACSFGLMLFPDRAKGFAELRRVLRPGGRAMVSGWAGPDKFEAFGLFLGAMKAAFPDLPPPPGPPPVFSLSDPADFRVQMEAGGFTDVEVDFVARDLEVTGLDQMWSMLTSGAPPVRMLLDRVGSEGEGKLRDSLSAIVQQRFGSGPIRLTNVATVGCGVAG